MLFLQNRDSLFSKLKKTQNRERVQNQHYIKLNYTNSNHSLVQQKKKKQKKKKTLKSFICIHPRWNK